MIITAARPCGWRGAPRRLVWPLALATVRPAAIVATVVLVVIVIVVFIVIVLILM